MSAEFLDKVIVIDESSFYLLCEWASAEITEELRNTWIINFIQFKLDSTFRSGYLPLNE